MADTILQGELFPTAVDLHATIAMERDETFVTQCSWCGLLVCADRKEPLGDCPACTGRRPVDYPQSWWGQEVPVGPFRARGEVFA